MKQRAVTATTKLPQENYECEECGLNVMYWREIIARDTYIGCLRGILYDLTFNHIEKQIKDLKQEAIQYLKKTSYDVIEYDPEVKEYLNDWEV